MTCESKIFFEDIPLPMVIIMYLALLAIMLQQEGPICKFILTLSAFNLTSSFWRRRKGGGLCSP